MNAPDTRYRHLARWLLEQEQGDGRAGPTPAGAVERVGEAIYFRLAPLVTVAGGQAFLSRSLHLARREYPFLEGVQAGPTAETCFIGLDQALDGIDPATARDAFVTLFAHMLRLLATFIGEDLTMHAIREAWPEAQLQEGG